MDYSAHGFHWLGSLRVYHQGGLNCYCGFYVIANLINFLSLREDPNAPEAGDVVGAEIDNEAFRNFNKLIEKDAFRRFFFSLKEPFGGGGLEAPELFGALTVALKHFKFKAQPKIEEDVSIGSEDRRQNNYWFRIGAEKPFVAPNSADDALGIACVIEDNEDKDWHWVVLVGKNYLEGMDIGCAGYWNGIVLDSDRGYQFWKCDVLNQTLDFVIRNVLLGYRINSNSIGIILFTGFIAV